MENRKHYAAAVASFTIWGFFSIALRAVREFSPGTILYFRILFSTVVALLVLALIRKGRVRRDLEFYRSLTPRQRNVSLALILSGGLLLTVNWLTYIYVVNSINIKTASFTYLICPVLTAVLGYVLLSEKMTRLQWIAVTLCAVSCVLIGLNSTLELQYSLFTAVSYALYLITQRKVQGFDRMVILAIQVVVSLVLLTVMFPLLVSDVPADGLFYFILLVIAIVFTILPLFLNLYALNRIKAATIGILMYLNPLLNFVLAITLFHEHVNALQWAGYAVILGAVVLFNVPYFGKVREVYRTATRR